jgi:uncharacterized OB-fold protein
VTGFSVWLCESCGRCSFPKRELCPYCGGRAFVAEPVDRGVVTEVTSHRGADIAGVRVRDDVNLLARAEPGLTAGAEVELRSDGGAPVAAAGVDAPS